MKMSRIGRLRRESDFESLFWNDDSSHPLRMLIVKKTSRVNSNCIERHIEMLETVKESERDFFWQEHGPSNLLAFLYMISDRLDMALQQLKLTLKDAPYNLNAIIGYIRIMEEQFHGSKAKEEEDKYSGLLQNKREMEKQKLICQGEIAYACSFFGPDFYIQAIDKYEALLDTIREDRTDWDDNFNGYVVRWQYYLAYTYNRMLNKGHKQKLAEKLGSKDISKMFDKISNLYDAVIRSSDVFYKGKAMIDLVDTHKKCETAGSCQNIRFPYDSSSDNYVRLAMEKAPSDPHVLERCGRHYRQKARTPKDFEHAIAIFDDLLESHRKRHVAWHHKGLANRALWHIVGKYPQEKLYRNCARKGDKKRLRKCHGQALRTDHSTDAASKCSENFASVSLPHQSASRPLNLQLQSMSVDESATRPPEIPHSSRETPQSAPAVLPTIHPWNSCEIGDVPKQLKKPDFFDKLRTKNPPVTNNRSRKFLEQAKVCFEQAKEITKGTCSPYIVDLARCLISFGKHSDAEREFAEACRLEKTMNNNDATYVFEQWALLRHSQAKQLDEDATETRDEMRDVASVYRKAILSAVRARERSRVAFYKLRKLLDKELQHDPSNTALQLEYDVLSNCMERYRECKEVLIEALKNDEETRNIAWEMIRLLHCRRHPHDAATAFMYLTALHEANQLALEESAAAADVGESDRQLLIDVVYLLVTEGDQTATADSGQTFGEIFRWMIGSRYISEVIKPDKDTPPPFGDQGEICVLSPKDDARGVDTVIRVLRDVCSVSVIKAFVEGNSDIRWGCCTIEGVRAAVAATQSVVVVEDSSDHENWITLCPVLEELLLHEINMCFVVDKDTDSSSTEQRYIAHWPRVCIDQDSVDDTEFAHRLLKAMFCGERVN